MFHSMLTYVLLFTYCMYHYILTYTLGTHTYTSDVITLEGNLR